MTAKQMTITIDTCTDCPNCNILLGDMVCSETSLDIEPGGIPDWCPLESAPSESDTGIYEGAEWKQS